MITNTPHQEVYTHTYKGIAVVVKIDYENAEVSLMENETLDGAYKTPKKWLFANRTPEYLGSWITILDAMKSAISEAKKKVEDYEKAREAEKEEQIEHIVLAGRVPKVRKN